MSILIPPFVGAPAAAPSGGVLAVDEIWLREPRLLVPGQLPVGNGALALPGSTMKLKTAFAAQQNLVRKSNLWTTNGSPTKQGFQGSLGYYFGSGNYFYASNLNLGGDGSGNDLESCFAEIYVIGVTSVAAGQSVAGGEMSNATDDGPSFFISIDGSTAKILFGTYYTVMTVTPGTVLTVVRTYSDFNPYPQAVFANGALITTVNGYRNVSDANVYLGTGYGGQFTKGVVLFYALFKDGTPLLGAAARDISGNPFQIFSPS